MRSAVRSSNGETKRQQPVTAPRLRAPAYARRSASTAASALQIRCAERIGERVGSRACCAEGVRALAARCTRDLRACRALANTAKFLSALATKHDGPPRLPLLASDDPCSLENVDRRRRNARRRRRRKSSRTQSPRRTKGRSPRVVGFIRPRPPRATRTGCGTATTCGTASTAPAAPRERRARSSSRTARGEYKPQPTAWAADGTRPEAPDAAPVLLRARVGVRAHRQAREHGVGPRRTWRTAAAAQQGGEVERGALEARRAPSAATSGRRSRRRRTRRSCGGTCSSTEQWKPALDQLKRSRTIRTGLARLRRRAGPPALADGRGGGAADRRVGT